MSDTEPKVDIEKLEKRRGDALTVLLVCAGICAVCQLVIATVRIYSLVHR